MDITSKRTTAELIVKIREEGRSESAAGAAFLNMVWSLHDLAKDVDLDEVDLTDEEGGMETMTDGGRETVRITDDFVTGNVAPSQEAKSWCFVETDDGRDRGEIGRLNYVLRNYETQRFYRGLIKHAVVIRNIEPQGLLAKRT